MPSTHLTLDSLELKESCVGSHSCEDISNIFRYRFRWEERRANSSYIAKSLFGENDFEFRVLLLLPLTPLGAMTKQ